MNPNGTHSTVHSTGSGTGIIVNPNGTHSTFHSTGDDSGVIVNPNGTHSTFHSASKNVKVVVNANGTQSMLHLNGNSDEEAVNPNGQFLQFDTIDSGAASDPSHRNLLNKKREGMQPKWWEPRKPKKEPDRSERKD